MNHVKLRICYEYKIIVLPHQMLQDLQHGEWLNKKKATAGLNLLLNMLLNSLVILTCHFYL